MKRVISMVLILLIIGSRPIYGHTLPDKTQKISVNVLGFNIEVETKPILKEKLIYFDVKGLMLHEGIASEEVVRLHSFLASKGYIGLGDGAYFNSETNKAVKDYQGKVGLDADGYVGPDTYKKINEDIQNNSISIPEIIVKFEKEVPNGIWLIINKSNNTLYYLEGEVLKEKYHVATGKQSTYTPEGKFTIVMKAINPYWGGAGGKFKPVKGGVSNNPLGKRWMGLSVGGGGEYGIHGNAAPNSIGTYASLGCIRMNNSEVEYLYDLIPKGTKVWIGGEDKLAELGVKYIQGGI